MFCTDGMLQYTVRVDKPDPLNIATAVARNLEGAPTRLQDEAAKDRAVTCILGGMNLRDYLSAGFAAPGENANGVPFNLSHVYASGNFYGCRIGDGLRPLQGRYTHGPSLDGKGEYSVHPGKPFGEEPTLAAPVPSAYAHKEQITAATGILGRIKRAVTGEA